MTRASLEQYLNSLSIDYMSGRNLRSMHQRSTVPRYRTEIASKQFSVYAPRVWNSLPIDIGNSYYKSIDSIHITFI